MHSVNKVPYKNSKLLSYNDAPIWEISILKGTLGLGNFFGLDYLDRLNRFFLSSSAYYCCNSFIACYLSILCFS